MRQGRANKDKRKINRDKKRRDCECQAEEEFNPIQTEPLHRSTVSVENRWPLPPSLLVLAPSSSASTLAPAALAQVHFYHSHLPFPFRMIFFVEMDYELQCIFDLIGCLMTCIFICAAFCYDGFNLAIICYVVPFNAVCNLCY